MDKKELLKYAVAYTYGDGSLAFHGKECRFEATCIVDNMDYILWRKSILENITGVGIYEVKDKRPTRRLIIKTYTQCHPLFTQIYQRLYLNGRKVLDPHYLKLFDWETLAILYMDDGNLRQCHPQDYKGKVYKPALVANIATHSFSYSDNLMLKETIKNNLGIEFNINRACMSTSGNQLYMLVLRTTSFPRFRDNITPYMQKSFMYKLYPNAELVNLNDNDGDIVRSAENNNLQSETEMNLTI